MQSRIKFSLRFLPELLDPNQYNGERGWSMAGQPAGFNHESFSIIRFAPIAFQFAIILAQKLNFPPISFTARSWVEIVIDVSVPTKTFTLRRLFAGGQ